MLGYKPTFLYLVLDPFGIGTVGSAIMEKNKSYVYEMENKLIKNGTVI